MTPLRTRLAHAAFAFAGLFAGGGAAWLVGELGIVYGMNENQPTITWIAFGTAALLPFVGLAVMMGVAERVFGGLGTPAAPTESAASDKETPQS
jgi:hypothetical protein